MRLKARGHGPPGARAADMTETVEFIVNPTLRGLTTDCAVFINTAMRRALVPRLPGVRIRKKLGGCGLLQARIDQKWVDRRGIQQGD